MPSRFAGKKEILQIMMRDGSIEVDTGAIKIGAQLVSNSVLNGVALPVRQPTATYEHKEINRAPIKRRSVHFETVDPIAPDFDSQFTLRDSPNIWQASSLELDREQNDTNRTNNLLQGIAMVAASIGFLMALSTTAFIGDSEAELLAEKERIEEQVRRETYVPPPPPPPPPVLPSGRNNGGQEANTETTPDTSQGAN